jgi:hypothetical protein
MKRSNRKPRGETKFPGVIRHAETLGCHRVHLHLVLSGKRHSSKLLRAYKALLTSEGRAIPTELQRRAA